MDSASEDLYLQKIEEFVHDEDKIVTFRWLSSTLGISSNDSKRLLEKFLADRRSTKPNDLGVTYLLAGMIEENKLAFAIVKEEELEDKRDSLINVTSQQIYSVQKSKQTDLHAIGLVDCFDMHKPSETPIIGTVKSSKCIKRVFKAKKALPPPREPVIKGKSSFFTKNIDKVEPKVNNVAPKQNSVKNIEPATNSNEKKAPSKAANGFANFFTKGASKPEPKPKAPEKPEEKRVEKEQLKMDTKTRMINLVDSDSGSEDIISATPQSQQTKENQKPKRSYKRQKKQNKNNAPSPKRRKRIVEHNDSDSDDIFGNDEEDKNMQEDLIQNSEDDSEPMLKPPAPLAPKNKRRKLINRTFEDEEGYIVTRQEWVTASGSDEDEPEFVKTVVLEKKEVKDKPKVKEDKLNKSQDSSDDKPKNGKTKGGVKGKKVVAANQKTLTSFFTRK